MKGMLLCKRGRQDIQPGIAFLTKQVAHVISDKEQILRELLKENLKKEIDLKLLLLELTRLLTM
jgi:hypothetical protein